MKKLLFLLCFFPVLFLSSCNKQDTAILLSENPININDFSSFSSCELFKVRQRIYFVLISRKPIENPVLRLQVAKMENKYGYSILQVEVPYAVDMERGQNLHAVTDYFTLHQDGDYFIRIYSKDNLKKPIAEAQFSVEKL